MGNALAELIARQFMIAIATAAAVGAAVAVPAVIYLNTPDEAYDPVIRIGGDDFGGRCSVDIHLSTWPDMNRMGVYRWVAACEAAVAKDAP